MMRLSRSQMQAHAQGGGVCVTSRIPTGVGMRPPPPRKVARGVSRDGGGGRVLGNGDQAEVGQVEWVDMDADERWLKRMERMTESQGACEVRERAVARAATAEGVADVLQSKSGVTLLQNPWSRAFVPQEAPVKVEMRTLAAGLDTPRLIHGVLQVRVSLDRSGQQDSSLDGEMERQLRAGGGSAAYDVATGFGGGEAAVGRLVERLRRDHARGEQAASRVRTLTRWVSGVGVGRREAD